MNNLHLDYEKVKEYDKKRHFVLTKVDYHQEYVNSQSIVP